MRANFESISYRCVRRLHLLEVAFVWELTKDIIQLPLGCLQAGGGINTALEATHGKIDGFFSQLPYKCHLERWLLWEIDLRFALNSPPGW